MSNNNQTNEIPWTCYHPHPMRTYDDEAFWDGENYSFTRVPRDRPDFEGVVSFVDRRGRTLSFSRIPCVKKFHEYTLASLLGEWILTGKRVLDFDNLSMRVRIKNLCHKIFAPGKVLEHAIHERDKDYWFTGFFIKAYTEFQYQTAPISLTTARNLRFYEHKFDPGYDDQCEVHHILPKCEFEEYETDIRNLVKIPKPVHQLLHDVYDDINHGKKPGEAFRDRWLGAVPYKVESEHDLDLPKGFFEGICHGWFNKRTDVEIIRQQIADEIMICMDDNSQNELNLVMEWWTDDGTLMGKNYTIRDRYACLPWWWRQEYATIANMCAYIYADHLHRRLA